MTRLIRSRILRADAILLFMFGIFGLAEDLSSYLAGTFVLKGALEYLLLFSHRGYFLFMSTFFSSLCKRSNVLIPTRTH